MLADAPEPRPSGCAPTLASRRGQDTSWRSGANGQTHAQELYDRHVIGMRRCWPFTYRWLSPPFIRRAPWRDPTGIVRRRSKMGVSHGPIAEVIVPFRRPELARLAPGRERRCCHAELTRQRVQL